jgi:hypothetical protein
MHQIEGPGRKSGAKDIPGHKLDVHETARVSVLASMVEKDSVCIKANDLPSWANARAE